MRVSTGAWRRTCCSPLAQPAPVAGGGILPTALLSRDGRAYAAVPCFALIRGKTPTSYDGRSFPGFRQNRASVLARSLLAAGPMQECQPSPLQCRIHEAREVLPPQCAGDDAAALGAEQASSAGAERGPRGRSRDTGSYASPGSQDARARTKAGVEPPLASVALVANLETLGVVGAPSRMPTSSELRFAMNSGATPGPTPRSRRVLADRLTCDAQQALRRCRSHSPSGHQPTPANLFPDGR